MKLMRERLRRDGLHAVGIERVETSQVDREPVGGELGDLIAELLALDRQFHKDFIAVPAGTGTIEQRSHIDNSCALSAFWRPRRSSRRAPAPHAQVATAARAASPAALLAYPGFYQGQLVVVRGNLVTRDQPVLLSPTIDRSIPLIFSGPSPADGPVELRASFWDVGRLQREDPRIVTLGLDRLLAEGLEGDWPRPGEVVALDGHRRHGRASRGGRRHVAPDRARSSPLCRADASRSPDSFAGGICTATRRRDQASVSGTSCCAPQTPQCG